ncbi:MAG: alginate export family protein, partial [Myxococcales bacterium]|nr:alginate export family protein [Myxococcales bacterium]
AGPGESTVAPAAEAPETATNQPPEPSPGRFDPRPIEWQLGAKDAVTVGLSASYWIRGEAREEGPASWQILHRARLGTRLRYRPLTLAVEIQDVRRWGSETSLRATDPSLGLGRTYLELAGETGKAEGFVRIGRQSMSYGNEWLIGAAMWNPNTQLLDGVRAHGEYGMVSLDVAGVLTAMPTRFETETETIQTSGDWLGIAELGIHPHQAFALDAYLLTHDRGPTAETAGLHRTIVSPGARIYGEPLPGLRYDIEAYLQRGRWDGRPHRAWAGAASLRYQSKIGATKLSVLAAYAIASGSSCSNDPEQGSCDDGGVHRDFFAFFGSRHRVLGYADMFLFTNVRDLQIGPELAVGKWAKAELHYHLLQLNNPRGAWIRPNGSLVGVGWDPSNQRRTVGHEIDLRLRFTPWWPLTIEPGYALFLPDGAGPSLLGSKAPIHFGYLLVAAAF